MVGPRRDLLWQGMRRCIFLGSTSTTVPEYYRNEVRYSVLKYLEGFHEYVVTTAQSGNLTSWLFVMLEDSPTSSTCIVQMNDLECHSSVILGSCDGVHMEVPWFSIVCMKPHFVCRTDLLTVLKAVKFFSVTGGSLEGRSCHQIWSMTIRTIRADHPHSSQADSRGGKTTILGRYLSRTKLWIAVESGWIQPLNPKGNLAKAA